MKLRTLWSLLVLTFACTANGQIVTWNFENTLAASNAMIGITAGSVTISSGTIQYQGGSSGSGNTIGYASSWATGNSFDSSKKYLEFQITVATGYSLNLSNISIELGRTDTGPNLFQLQYSLDGFNSNSFSIKDGEITSTDADKLDVISSSLPLDSVSGTLTFRIWAYDAPSTGNLRFNDFQLYGTITPSAIPEPSTYAAMLGGLALGVMCLRRKKLKKAA